MSLTTGRGPLSARPAGTFTPPLPDGQLVYVEPFNRKVRGITNGATVLESEAVVLVHRQGRPPEYAFPARDVPADLDSQPLPEAPGYVQVPWDALEEWYEEDEPMLGHPRNPYHRVDCIRTSRRLTVEVEGTVLVDTGETLGVYETSLPPRLYVPKDAVRMDLLRPSDTVTYCPYKGSCSYWTAVVGDTVVEDVAWSYEDPLPESLPLGGFLSFDPSRASVVQELPAST